MNRTRKAVAAIGLTGLLLTGCGGGGGKSTPQEFAKALCTAFSTWFQGIRQRTVDLGSQFLDAAGSPEKGRDAIRDFLRETIESTDGAIARIQGAGAPEAANGERIYTIMLDAFREGRQAFQDALGRVTALPTSDPEKFVKDLEKLSEDVSSVGEGINQRIESRLGDVKSSELEAAFSAEESCTALGGA